MISDVTGTAVSEKVKEAVSSELKQELLTQLFATGLAGPTRRLLDAVFNSWAEATKSKKPSLHRWSQEQQMLEQLKKLGTNELGVLSAAAAK